MTLKNNFIIDYPLRNKLILKHLLVKQIDWAILIVISNLGKNVSHLFVFIKK